MSDPSFALRAPAVARIPGVAFMLAIMLVMFAATSSRFLSVDNLLNVLVQSTILLMVALPMTLIIMTEGLDLSVGAVLTFASLVLAITVVNTGSVVLAILGALATGLVFGIVNGWLVAYQGLPPFVVTLGTLGVAQGLALIVSDGQSVIGIPEGIRVFYGGQIVGLPIPILMAIVTYAGFHMLLYHTRFGTYVSALGGNREALKLAGINDRVLLVIVYTIGGIMAGAGALLLSARMNAGHPTAAIGMEFDVIAAVAVGGTAFEKGNGWLLGTLMGVLTIGLLRNGLNLLAIPSSVQVCCVGFLVILAMLIDSYRSPAP